MAFDLRYMLLITPKILAGLKYTLLIAAAGILAGFIIGSLVGMARNSNVRGLKYCASLYVGFIRGTPLMVQALYIYFAIPTLLHFNLDVLMAGIICIAVNSSAYISEVVRGAIQAIPKGQNEAALSLGMSGIQTMMHITAPQAFKLMIPPLGNQFIISLKDTSLLTVIGIAELTRQATQTVSISFKAVEVYTALALIYLVLTTSLNYGLRYIERKLK
jgi:glutamine transport system permease protein